MTGSASIRRPYRTSLTHGGGSELQISQAKRPGGLRNGHLSRPDTAASDPRPLPDTYKSLRASSFHTCSSLCRTTSPLPGTYLLAGRRGKSRLASLNRVVYHSSSLHPGRRRPLPEAPLPLSPSLSVQAACQADTRRCTQECQPNRPPFM